MRFFGFGSGVQYAAMFSSSVMDLCMKRSWSLSCVSSYRFIYCGTTKRQLLRRWIFDERRCGCQGNLPGMHYICCLDIYRFSIWRAPEQPVAATACCLTSHSRPHKPHRAFQAERNALERITHDASPHSLVKAARTANPT
jgi:hypothetical protein